MACGGASSNASRLRKRVEADTTSPSSLKRARDGSAFAKCEECNKDVPVALISFHNCSLDAKIKMNLEAQVMEMPTEAKKKPATEKKRVTKTEPSSKRGKSAKDPNKPKRPAIAFFVFMEGFRKSFKESNPHSNGVAKLSVMMPLAKQCAFEEPSVETISGENVLTWPHVVKYFGCSTITIDELESISTRFKFSSMMRAPFHGSAFWFDVEFGVSATHTSSNNAPPTECVEDLFCHLVVLSTNI